MEIGAVISVSPEQRRTIQECLSAFHDWFEQSIVSVVRNEVGYYKAPAEISTIQEQLHNLEAELTKVPSSAPLELASVYVPLVKTMVTQRRRTIATHLEVPKARTWHPQLRDSLDEPTRSLDSLLEAEWIQGIGSLQVPRLADFISMQRVDAFVRHKVRLQEREYDEKFHILQSPKLFLEDLNYYRETCDARGVAVSVAYIDIDDFKRFNTLYGESNVDRDILPKFMEVLEAHVFAHGFAYRFGGDEYTLLLPNIGNARLLDSLDGLRCRIMETEYRGCSEIATISVGVCTVDSNCPLTNREVEERANLAKRYAKTRGKNRIATYRTNQYRADDLYIARPLDEETVGVLAGTEAS